MTDKKTLFPNCLITGKPIKDKKWFRVTATMSTDLYAFVEAENKEEAYEKACRGDEPDAGHYVEETHGGDWNIDDANEVTTVDGEIELKLWLPSSG